MKDPDDSDEPDLKIFLWFFKMAKIPFACAAVLLTACCTFPDVSRPFLLNLIDPYTLRPNSAASKLMENKQGPKITSIEVLCKEMPIIINKPDELECINRSYANKRDAVYGNSKSIATIVHFEDGSKHHLYLIVTENPRGIGFEYTSDFLGDRIGWPVLLTEPIPPSLVDTIEKLWNSPCDD